MGSLRNNVVALDSASPPTTPPPNARFEHRTQLYSLVVNVLSKFTAMHPAYDMRSKTANL